MIDLRSRCGRYIEPSERVDEELKAERGGFEKTDLMDTSRPTREPMNLEKATWWIIEPKAGEKSSLT